MVTLSVERGLYLTGQVTTPGGAFKQFALVSSSSEYGVRNTGMTDGKFALGPMSSIVHDVRAHATRNLSDSELHKASPGGEPLLLELGPGASLAGRFVDAATGASCSARLISASLELNFLVERSDELPAPILVDGLRPGRYDLTASTRDGRGGIRRGVESELGAAKRELVIAVQPRARLRVRYRGPQAQVRFRVLSAGALVAADSLNSSGSAELDVLPGKLFVQLNLGSQAFEQREVHCDAGEVVEVVFH